MRDDIAVFFFVFLLLLLLRRRYRFVFLSPWTGRVSLKKKRGFFLVFFWR